MTTRTASSRPRSARGLAAAAAALLLVVGLAACGDDGDDTETGDETTTTAASTGGADDPGSDDADGGTTEGIEAQDFALTSLTVAPGAEVTVSNVGQKPHTATADDGAFDSGTIQPGATGSVTAPTEPGSYPFHCEIHPSMAGTLTVQG
jgi:plastocyanin